MHTKCDVQGELIENEKLRDKIKVIFSCTHIC